MLIPGRLPNCAGCFKVILGLIPLGPLKKKPAQVDVAGLAPGEYALIVGVTDVHTNQRVTARSLFRLLTDAGLHELLTAAER